MFQKTTPLALVAAVAGITLAVGCSRDGAPPHATADAPAAQEAEVTRDPREAEVLGGAEYLALPRFANADMQRGERIFLQCRACHTLGEGEPHRPAGPNLWGMFGSVAAERESFSYSDALRGSGVVWTPATMEEWLVRPSSFVPGNRMAFAGIRREEDRTNLIAYLIRETTPASGD